MLKNLRALRTEYGISQQRLAEVLFVTQASINRYENHGAEPEIDILKRMADYFNTTIDYLVGYSDQRYRQEDIKSHQLTPREAGLVDGFRELDEAQQKCVEQVVRLFGEKEE